MWLGLLLDFQVHYYCFGWGMRRKELLQNECIPSTQVYYFYLEYTPFIVNLAKLHQIGHLINGRITRMYGGKSYVTDLHKVQAWGSFRFPTFSVILRVGDYNQLPLQLPRTKKTCSDVSWSTRFIHGNESKQFAGLGDTHHVSIVVFCTTYLLFQEVFSGNTMCIYNHNACFWTASTSISANQLNTV